MRESTLGSSCNSEYVCSTTPSSQHNITSGHLQQKLPTHKTSLAVSHYYQVHHVLASTSLLPVTPSPIFILPVFTLPQSHFISFIKFTTRTCTLRGLCLRVFRALQNPEQNYCPTIDVCNPSCGPIRLVVAASLGFRAEIRYMSLHAIAREGNWKAESNHIANVDEMESYR